MIGVNWLCFFVSQIKYFFFFFGRIVIPWAHILSFFSAFCWILHSFKLSFWSSFVRLWREERRVTNLFYYYSKVERLVNSQCACSIMWPSYLLWSTNYLVFWMRRILTLSWMSCITRDKLCGSFQCIKLSKLWSGSLLVTFFTLLYRFNKMVGLRMWLLPMCQNYH